MVETKHKIDLNLSGDGTEQWSLIDTVGSNSNLLHRVGGPAFIRYRKHKITSEAWFQNGRYYRSGGDPNLIEYNEDGVVTKDAWMRNENRYYFTGPAWISYGDNGDERHEMWVIDNTPFDIDDLADYIKLSKADKVLIKMVYGK